MNDKIDRVIIDRIAMQIKIAAMMAPSSSAIQFFLKNVDSDYAKDYLAHGKEIDTISLHKHFYIKLGNPLHAWKSIKIVKDYQLHKLPEWAVNAVVEYSSAVLDIDAGEASTSTAFNKALGINGHMIKEFRRHEIWLDRYYLIHERNQAGEILEAIFADMSPNLEMSEETLKNQFYDFQSELDGPWQEDPFGP